MNVVCVSQIIEPIPGFHPRHHHHPRAQSSDVVLAQLSNVPEPARHGLCKRGTLLYLGQPLGPWEENRLRHNNRDMMLMPSACACSLIFRLGRFEGIKVILRTLYCELALHGICTHLLST